VLEEALKRQIRDDSRASRHPVDRSHCRAPGLAAPAIVEKVRFRRSIHCEWVGNLSTGFELHPPEGWAVTSKIPDERGDQVEAVYRHLKRTLRECHDQLDRIEEMLRNSKQDNEPRK